MKKMFLILVIFPIIAFTAATKMAMIEGKVISFDVNKIEVESFPKKKKVSFERKYLDSNFKNIHAGDWVKAYLPASEVMNPVK